MTSYVNSTYTVMAKSIGSDKNVAFRKVFASVFVDSFFHVSIVCRKTMLWYSGYQLLGQILNDGNPFLTY